MYDKTDYIYEFLYTIHFRLFYLSLKHTWWKFEVKNSFKVKNGKHKSGCMGDIHDPPP